MTEKFDELKLTPQKKTQIGVRFDDDDLNKLDHIANGFKTTRQEVVRAIVKKYLAINFERRN